MLGIGIVLAKRKTTNKAANIAHLAVQYATFGTLLRRFAGTVTRIRQKIATFALPKPRAPVVQWIEHRSPKAVI